MYILWMYYIQVFFRHLFHGNACTVLLIFLFVFTTVGNHYIRNRSERKTVREDVKAAKITYLEEVKNAQLLPDQDVQNM